MGKGFPGYAASLLIAAVVTAFPASAFSLDLGGFLEGAYGARTASDTTEKDSFNLNEARLQLKGAYSPSVMEDYSGELTFKYDLLADGYENQLKGTAREAVLFFTPIDIVDVKAGRQVLTWGTGDYLFVNDLFPKDYVSFFIGRDDEYLKQPNDALRVSVFFPAASLDVAIIPVMEPDNSVRGERVSFYDGLAGRISGKEASRKFIEPAEKAENGEVAARIYRTFGSYEGALYLFRGFYKEPRGIRDAASQTFFYPRLNVYGFSLRGPFIGGIGSFEAGYYDSRDDTGGIDPLVENSAVKYLFGHSRDLGDGLKLGLQYLVEQMLDYNGYLRGLGANEPARDEFRQLLTLRLTKLMYTETVEAGVFVFYSPTDSDAYIRPSVSYKATDALKLTAGANVFTGRYDHTEFGQIERNDNLYVRLRYSF